MATIYEYSRMCKYYKYCDGCPLVDTIKDDTCGNFIANFPDEATNIINDWIKEHPITTYASNFYDKFPNATRDKNNCPEMCLMFVYGGECPYDDKFTSDEFFGKNYCKECWNRELPQTTNIQENNYV